ncbi:uncharacterized protein METZ01_LOCUS484664, partial [marine metagenome]
YLFLLTGSTGPGKSKASGYKWWAAPLGGLDTKTGHQLIYQCLHALQADSLEIAAPCPSAPDDGARAID